MNLAFALVYNRHFRDKTFVQVPESGPRMPDLPPVGICIEGVRVEFDPPGFSRGSGFLGIADLTGKNAPRTNVARTSLESVVDKNKISTAAFSMYMDKVQSEIDRLQTDENFSLSYAVSQFPFIAAPLTARGSDNAIRDTAFLDFPQFLLEDESGRRVVSASELITLGGFWTVSSKSIQSLIELLKDTPAAITCIQVAKICQFRGNALPNSRLVTNAGSSQVTQRIVRSEFEISEIRGSVADRRLDIFWRPKEESGDTWFSNVQALDEYDYIDSDALNAYGRYRESRRRSPWRNVVWLPDRSFHVEGLDSYLGVAHFEDVFLLPDTAVTDFLRQLNWRENPDDRLHFLLFMDAIFPNTDHMRKTSRILYASEIEYSLNELVARFGDTSVDVHGFMGAVKSCEGRLLIFDPWSWSRNEQNDVFEIY